MFTRIPALLLGFALVTLAHAADPFEAGKQYFIIEPQQPTSTGDKIEVLEVFSYGCPACNQFQATIKKLKAELPANTELTYLPASFNPSEDWPVFQRAFLAAQTLGVTDKTHDATYDAIWKDDGALRISDLKTHRLVSPLPTIEDVAKFYAGLGVNKDDFLGAANSFAVNMKMKRADAQIKTYGVDSTPTLIINGKYRFTGSSAGGLDNTVALAKFLIAKESAGK
ncbi:MAG: thiol:disulfide interchange protein DsbA/DsbL [Rhodanobacter sp.]|jgi:thiol:disulfide interchange protein DsbA|nr:thiol:disulfide interchange protein DsbA/DsbL [Rhodanobacter sp.]